MNHDLENILKPGAKLYFVGIGGIAMSAVASIAKGLGFDVSGSDSKEVYSPAKDVLDNSKIKYQCHFLYQFVLPQIHYSDKACSISLNDQKAKLVVYSFLLPFEFLY